MTLLKKKEYYRLFCQKTPDLPLFLQDWWLDAALHGGRDRVGEWQVALSFDKEGKIIGALPYLEGKFKKVIPAVTMPQLTPFMGIWLAYPEGQTKNETRYSFEHKVLDDLIGQLPEKPIFEQRYQHTLQNWLPFYWKGYQQTTRYTYVLEDLSDTNVLWDNLKSTVRNRIRKASKEVDIVAINTLDDAALQLLYENNKSTYQRQKMKIPYTFELLQSLDTALTQRRQRTIYLAKDKKTQELHGAVYLVWDKTTAYSLLISSDTILRDSGAVPLLLWQAIQDTAQRGQSFDFEGSMLQNIERMFRGFGAVQKTYFQVTKEKNIFYKIIKEIL